MTGTPFRMILGFTAYSAHTGAVFPYTRSYVLRVNMLRIKNQEI